MTHICPKCQTAEMDVDECFPDHAVLRCRECFWRATPSNYHAEWQEIYDFIEIDRKSRNRRIILYAFAILASSGLILWRLS